jgi:hypothetical protein
MPQSSRDLKSERRSVSRRSVIKGGLATAAGAVATMMAVTTGTTAVTPMDVKRAGFGQYSAPITVVTASDDTAE